MALDPALLTTEIATALKILGYNITGETEYVPIPPLTALTPELLEAMPKPPGTQDGINWTMILCNAIANAVVTHIVTNTTLYGTVSGGAIIPEGSGVL